LPQDPPRSIDLGKNLLPFHLMHVNQLRDAANSELIPTPQQDNRAGQRGKARRSGPGWLRRVCKASQDRRVDDDDSIGA
jgi:hypothetical protein